MLGSALGPYRLQDAIGEGGMGVVYRAYDEHLRRIVAIKLLPTGEATDPERRARFLHEARTASSLNHPNIVTIYDVSRDGGRDFLVMEYVPGRTLRSILDAGPLSVEQVFSLAQQIANGLAAAHAAGIVHRDLKPNNVIVTEADHVKILDFGLAKAHADWSGASEQQTMAVMTQAGRVLGTPAYMSPEQAEGRPLGPASDIFSFGVLVYEMLTGQRPFPGTTTASVVHEIVYRDPEPLARLRPDTPRAFRQVVDRCLSKNPAARFGNGSALVHALQKDSDTSRSARLQDVVLDWMGGVRRLVGPRSSGASSPPWRVPMIAAALLLAAGTVWLLTPAGQSVGHSLLKNTVGLSRSPADAYQAGLDHLDSYFRPADLNEALALFEEAIAQDPEYAAAFAGLAEAQWRQFRANRDPSLLDRAVASADRAIALSPQLARAHTIRAILAVEAADYETAERESEQALRLDPTSAQAHRSQANLYQAQNRPADADSALTRALALEPENWELHTLRGTFYFAEGQYPEAVEAFRRSAECAPKNPIAFRNLGGAQHMVGDFPGAAASLQTSLELQPDPITYGNLGTVYFFQGQYAEAAPAFRRAVEMDPNNSVNWRNLGDCLRQVPGSEQGAREAYVRSAQLLQPAWEQNPEDPGLSAELALCLARGGSSERAQQLLGPLVDSAPDNPEILYTLTLGCEAVGDRDGALASLGRALGAGYPQVEIANDPELIDLRKDVRYHLLLVEQAPSP